MRGKPLLLYMGLAWAVGLSIGGCGGLVPDVDGGNPTTDASVVPDELLVTVMPGADLADVDALYVDVGVTVRERLLKLSVDRLRIDPTRREQTRDALAASPLIEAVTDNHVLAVEVTPNDPGYPSQWHLAAIEAPAAWSITTGNAQVLVAVLDTGVDASHPDLAAKLRSGGNTYDGVSGWQDVVGHGTGVAGVIGAKTNDERGTASVAWDCPLMPIRVTDDQGRATSWSVAAGIALAASSGAKVMNVSISPVDHDEIVLRQAELARLSGALVIFAAGNTGQEVVGGGSEAAVFVGATGRDGTLASVSTYGGFVDLVAPGVDIYTTYLDGQYGWATGTSFAAPIVSGVAALVWSIRPELQPRLVKEILMTTARDLGAPGEDSRFGVGQVNAGGAVELARAIVQYPDRTPPVVSILRPADGDTVQDATTISVAVADESDLVDVTLSVDGMPLGSDAVAPYQFVLQPAKFATGVHQVSVAARDVFGNAAEQTIALTFAGPGDGAPPSVSMVSPTEGAAVRGVVTVLADARGDQTLDRAEVFVDGRLIGTVRIGTVETRVAFNWNTGAADLAAGGHTVAVRVVDTSERASSASVQVNVSK